MMSKMQKTWLWIFGAMFVVPEILWSPIGNFIYSLFSRPVNGYSQLLRKNFLFDYQYESLLKIIIFIQLIGIVLFFIFWLKNKINIQSKILFWIVLFLSLLVLLISLFIAYIVFLFNPSFL